MGAQQFEQVGFGKTAKEAFTKAREQAAWEYGHGGYTGTLAEKYESVVVRRPKGSSLEAMDVAARLARMAPYDGRTVRQEAEKHFPDAWVDEAVRVWPTYDDKWGPAVQVPMSPSEEREYRQRRGLEGRHGTGYVFCGWASS